jgi:hypothetical protein
LESVELFLLPTGPVPSSSLLILSSQPNVRLSKLSQLDQTKDLYDVEHVFK